MKLISSVLTTYPSTFQSFKITNIDWPLPKALGKPEEFMQCLIESLQLHTQLLCFQLILV